MSWQFSKKEGILLIYIFMKLETILHIRSNEGPYQIQYTKDVEQMKETTIVRLPALIVPDCLFEACVEVLLKRSPHVYIMVQAEEKSFRWFQMIFWAC